MVGGNVGSSLSHCSFLLRSTTPLPQVVHDDVSKPEQSLLHDNVPSTKPSMPPHVAPPKSAPSHDSPSSSLLLPQTGFGVQPEKLSVHRCPSEAVLGTQEMLPLL